jgi:hypothetical protein
MQFLHGVCGVFVRLRGISLRVCRFLDILVITINLTIGIGFTYG